MRGLANSKPLAARQEIDKKNGPDTKEWPAVGTVTKWRSNVLSKGSASSQIQPTAALWGSRCHSCCHLIFTQRLEIQIGISNAQTVKPLFRSRSVHLQGSYGIRAIGLFLLCNVLMGHLHSLAWRLLWVNTIKVTEGKEMAA